MDIKERMYTVIQKRGIRQSELAKITGTTRQTINSYIHGRHQMRLEAIVLIASALHVSVDYLLGLSDKEETDSQQYFDVWAFSKNLKKVLNSREQSGENFAIMRQSVMLSGRVKVSCALPFSSQVSCSNAVVSTNSERITLASPSPPPRPPSIG